MRAIVRSQCYETGMGGEASPLRGVWEDQCVPGGMQQYLPGAGHSDGEVQSEAAT